MPTTTIEHTVRVETLTRSQRDGIEYLEDNSATYELPAGWTPADALELLETNGFTRTN